MKPVDHYMTNDVIVIVIGLQLRVLYKENILEMCYAIIKDLDEFEMFESTKVLYRT